MAEAIISFINMKGGVAKTTLLVNTADYLVRQHGKKVLVIDVDPQFNATQMLVDPDNYISYIKAGKHTILDVFDRGRKVVPSVVSGGTDLIKPSFDAISVYRVRENFELLPGNIELFRIEMAAGEGKENLLKRYIEAVSDHYDFILIDTPPTPSVWMTSALIASNYYIIPVKPDPISFTGIDLLKSVIEGRQETYGLNIKCIGVVLTITEDATINFSAAKDRLSKDATWGKFLYKSSLPKRVVIAREQGKQNTILDIEDSAAKSGMAGIVRELLSRIA